VGLDAEIRLAEGDKDGYSKNRVRVEIAYANRIVVTQLPQKGMARIPKSSPIKIFKDDDFARTRVWIVLTV
jgi:hypothetical protein